MGGAGSVDPVHGITIALLLLNTDVRLSEGWG